MDVFKLREAVVDEYRAYVESFVRVLDPYINDYVRKQLEKGELWPDSVLQLNPAYEPTDTLGELAANGTLRPETARFFGEGIRLHRHQREALAAAQRKEPYVVSTGTGSGKSLTYLVPIYDAILQAEPARHAVRAIIVYPMNALINSQHTALETYAKNFPDSPVRFAKYTGETKTEDRPAILKDPPHILLTNYVMLEYILTRPDERSLLETATRDLQFLVMDELHFYRGRQGADVAMLLRRLQQRAGHDLQVIGTSATIATEGNRDQRRAAIAEVATRLFGVNVPPTNVIDETLQRLTTVPAPPDAPTLRDAVLADPPTRTRESVTGHPLAAWIEEAFGIAHSPDGFVRREPETFEGAVQRLATETELDESLCRNRLRAALDAGNEAELQTGEPVFAFRLHQFLSSGSSVYATIEPSPDRILTMEAQYKVEGDRVLYPLAFCRECGQEYYLVSLVEEGGDKLIPRSPMVGSADEETPGEGGFFSIEDGGLWHGEDDELPDFWFDELKSGPRIKKGYGTHRPRAYHASPDGSLSLAGDGVRGWFQPRPLMLCLRCRAAFDLRNTSDFRKLSSLSQTGRSTATTIVVNAAVAGMRQDPTVDAEARKILSFTDNRQDASLQAGHLNDFVQVAQLRAGVVAAVGNSPLTFDRLGPAVFEAMNLQPADFLQTPVPVGTPGYQQGRKAMEDLEYKTLEDLGRDWRVAQPNLEQVGLIRIEYEGLRELAADDSLWRGLPAIGDASPTKREEVLRSFLDHLRMQLAIESDALTQDFTRRLLRNTRQWLREPWALGERDRLPLRSIALLPGVPPSHQEALRSVGRLGARSRVAGYLRSHWTWNTSDSLTAQDAEILVNGIVTRLKGHLLHVEKSGADDHGVRVLAGAIRWTAGSGVVPPPDPVRSRALYMRREIPGGEPNRFFSGLYGEAANQLKGMVGREHTGQISSERRVERENRFGAGELPVLFCSPTMELGVDIRDLNAVHMRNVPPTPANYAQRSGRAGRGGRPALVVTFAAQGNVHDQYFFRRRTRVIAGAVTPARMDLRNRELVEAHLYATWLATVSQPLHRSMAEILDLDTTAKGFPIQQDIKAQINDPRHEVPALLAARDVIARAQELRDAWWFQDEWLEDTIRNAPEKFDRAFDRWRETYQAATEMREAARKAMDSPSAPRQEREAAEQRHREALREIDLLLNRTTHLEADFYPYRYLASEGFLPGYNFPRLPVRALVNVGTESEAIDRARFLGLAEFGPHNVIYHEGQKHRIDSAILPQNGITERLRQARLCLECGYVHADDSLAADLCEHCGTRFDGGNSLLPQSLLEQPVMRTRVRERISSDEEERLRNGYHITTHFQFIPPWRPRKATVADGNGELLVSVLSAPAGVLWRINHGWRQGDHTGFVIDPQDGRWQSQAGQPDDDNDPMGPQRISAIKPFVKDNRNVLLLLPAVDAPSHSFQLTLLHALKRGIQLVYQVEEQEVAAELIGRGANQRLLLWEAAEGGTGAWERLLEERDGFAQVARKALELCHFDPMTGEPDLAFSANCAVACYECLLSYANQQEQRHLNRHEVRDFLLQLSRSHTSEPLGGRTDEEQFEWLLSICDPASQSERSFVEFLHRDGYRLPNEAQNRPEANLPTQPDFYYARDGIPGACVFVDGPDHDEPAQRARDDQVRNALAERGYRVIAIRTDQPFDVQVQSHADIFGQRRLSSIPLQGGP